MRIITRCALVQFTLLGILLLAAGAAWPQGEWPSLFRYTVALSTDETARYQTSASLSGPVSEESSLKIEGWWIGGRGENRAFVGDAYLDYDRQRVYLAAGRKYVPFGPAGLLVSPGFFGGEVQLRSERVTLQAISGSLQFTPGTGTTRFTYAGSRAPADEDFTAGRIALVLTEPAAEVPVTVGLNGIDILDDRGSSADISIEATRWLTLYGEAAGYGDGDAHIYGIWLSDMKMRSDGRGTIVVWYHRKLDVGFVPAAVGASAYFEGQTGWAGGLYHQFNSRRALGVFADGEETIVTLFGTVPL